LLARIIELVISFSFSEISDGSVPKSIRCELNPD